MGKNAVSSKHSDIDYIENEQIPGLLIFLLFMRFIFFQACSHFFDTPTPCLAHRRKQSVYFQNQDFHLLGIFFVFFHADIFSQLDDIETLESGGRLANMDKHMGNLSVSDSKSHGNNGSANIKLGPVITRKTLSHNSANSLNTLKRLPPQQPAKTRSIPITPEKSSVAKKSESSWPVSPARKV